MQSGLGLLELDANKDCQARTTSESSQVGRYHCAGIIVRALCKRARLMIGKKLPESWRATDEQKNSKSQPKDASN